MIDAVLGVLGIIGIFVAVFLIVRFVFLPLLLGSRQTAGDREWNRHVLAVESGKEPHSADEWAEINGHMAKVKR